MLWLAGLMGIASVGAASLITFPEPEDEEEEVLNADDIVHSGHDLLDQMEGLDGLNAPESDLFDLVAQDIQDIHAEQLGYSDNGVDLEPLDVSGYALEANAFDFEGDASAVDAAQDTAAEQEQVLVGDWITSGPASEIFDYEANSESLLLVWDDMTPSGEEPQVDVAPDPYDDEVMHVIMNEKSVAEVYGDPELTVADVTLIPLSSALIVGLEPA